MSKQVIIVPNVTIKGAEAKVRFVKFNEGSFRARTLRREPINIAAFGEKEWIAKSGDSETVVIARSPDRAFARAVRSFWSAPLAA